MFDPTKDSQLRDYMAGQALAGLTANGIWSGAVEPGKIAETTAKQVLPTAKLAYAFADAMLLAKTNIE